MSFSPFKQNWFEARRSCDLYGGQLAEIESADKNTAIAVAKTSAGITDAVWFGLNDIATEDTFVWASTGQETNYTDWRTGEPNNHGAGEDCIGIWVDNKWFDAPCLWTYYFACEKP